MALVARRRVAADLNDMTVVVAGTGVEPAHRKTKGILMCLESCHGQREGMWTRHKKESVVVRPSGWSCKNKQSCTRMARSVGNM